MPAIVIFHSTIDLSDTHSFMIFGFFFFNRLCAPWAQYIHIVPGLRWFMVWKKPMIPLDAVMSGHLCVNHFRALWEHRGVC